MTANSTGLSSSFNPAAFFFILGEFYLSARAIKSAAHGNISVCDFNLSNTIVPIPLPVGLNFTLSLCLIIIWQMSSLLFSKIRVPCKMVHSSRFDISCLSKTNSETRNYYNFFTAIESCGKYVFFSTIFYSRQFFYCIGIKRKVACGKVCFGIF